MGGRIEFRSKKLNLTTKITSEGNSSVIIGENVKLGDRTVISSTNGLIRIRDNCQFNTNIILRASCGGRIQVEDRCTVQRQCILVASLDAKLILGQDCMVSYFVLIRAGSSHNIIDLNTLNNLDDNLNRDVVIGQHVWLGMRSTIMNGVEIGSGSTGGQFFCVQENISCKLLSCR